MRSPEGALVPSPCPVLGQAPDKHFPPQIRGLELRLHHTHKVLRTHEEMQEKMKEVRFVVHRSCPCCDLQQRQPSSQTLSLTLSPGPVGRP